MKHVNPKTVAVIPAYNEEKRVGAVVREARKHVDSVLVVDDGSTDTTSAVAQKAGARVLRLPQNRGVGHATKKGVEYAINMLNAKWVVLLDADGQHPPERIPDILHGLEKGADIVFACRRFNAKMPLLKRFGNWFLSLCSRVLAGVGISDSQSGFKAFTSAAFRRMRLGADRYEICSEIIFETGRNGLKYAEVPIETIYLEGAHRKGVGVMDGFRTFSAMFRMRANRDRR